MSEKALTFGSSRNCKPSTKMRSVPRRWNGLNNSKDLIEVEVYLAQEQGVSARDIIEELAEKAQLYGLAYAPNKGWPDPARQEIFAQESEQHTSWQSTKDPSGSFSFLTKKRSRPEKVKEGSQPYFSPFWPSFLMVPIFLSDLVSLPSGFLMVPGGNPCFFSWLPTV